MPTVDVTRLRAGTINDHGDTIPDWDNVTEVTIADATLQPLTGDELLEHRDAAKTMLKIWVPAWTGIRDTDRIRVDAVNTVLSTPLPLDDPDLPLSTVGDIYDVSDVQIWTGLSLSHISAILTNWEG